MRPLLRQHPLKVTETDELDGRREKAEGEEREGGREATAAAAGGL